MMWILEDLDGNTRAAMHNRGLLLWYIKRTWPRFAIEGNRVYYKDEKMGEIKIMEDLKCRSVSNVG